MNRILPCGAALLSAVLAAQSVFAQTTATPPVKTPAVEEVIGQVYTYVEQMPQLPGGGGNLAIVNAIQSRVHYPVAALKKEIQGKVLVSFIVGKNGVARNAKIVQGIGGGCDEEVLDAVRQLPRFIPGTQDGKPVAVSFTVPITFRIQGSETAAADTTKTYPLVNEMPHLPGTNTSVAITQAIQRALVMPAEVANENPARKVFVAFTVGPSGVIRDIAVVRGLDAKCNSAALTAVQQLPRFVGGKLNGMPASVRLTAPILFGRLPQQP